MIEYFYPRFEDFLAKYAAKKDYTYTSYNAYNYKDNLSTSETNFRKI